MSPAPLDLPQAQPPWGRGRWTVASTCPILSLCTTACPPPVIPLPGAVRPPGAKRKQIQGCQPRASLHPQPPLPRLAPFLLTEAEEEESGSRLGPDPCMPSADYRRAVSGQQAGPCPSGASHSQRAERVPGELP